MSALRGGLAVGAVAGVVAVAAIAWAGVEHDRTQRGRLEALTRQLAEARGELADVRSENTELRASQRPSPPPPVFVGSARVDLRVADAIAERVLAASDARARAAAAASATDATTPTDRQLVARAAASRTLDDAMARGRLTREDMRAVRQTLADDVAGRAEFRRQLAVAINQRKIVPDDPRLLMP